MGLHDDQRHLERPDSKEQISSMFSAWNLSHLRESNHSVLTQINLKESQESVKTFRGTKYGDVFWDLDNTFHAISGYDPFRIIGILRNGVIPSGQNNITSNNSSDSTFTPPHSISVCISPAYFNNGETELHPISYAGNSVAFVINKRANYMNTHNSGIRDEGIIENGIPAEDIAGIIVDEETLDSDLRDLYLGFSQSSRGSIYSRFLDTVRQLTQYGHRINPDLFNDFIEMNSNNYLLSCSRSELEHLDQRVMSEVALCFSKLLRKPDVTLRDILNFYITDSIPIYNTFGHEISRDKSSSKPDKLAA